MYDDELKSVKGDIEIETGNRQKGLQGLEISDEQLDQIVTQVAYPAVWVGVKEAWALAESMLRNHVYAMVVKARASLPEQIGQKRSKVQWLEGWIGNLRDVFPNIQTAYMEGAFGKYMLLLMIASILVVLGDVWMFPEMFNKFYGLNITAGVLFSVVFIVGPYIVKCLGYWSWDVFGKKIFRRVLLFVWIASFFIFTISFYGSVSLDSAQAANASVSFLPSLQDPMGQSNFDPWPWLRFASFVSLWILVMCNSSGLVIIHSYFRDARNRALMYREELARAEAELDQTTQALGDLEQVDQGIEYFIDSKVARLKAKFFYAVIKQKEAAMRSLIEPLMSLGQDTQQGDQGKLSDKTSKNGRSLPRIRFPFIKMLAVVVPLGLGTLLASVSFAAEPVHVVLIQDMGRQAEALEDDYRGFGRLMQTLPEGASFELLGSDGIRYVRGSITGGYEREVQNRRKALAMQGMMLYKKIQTSPKEVRDYPRALMETLPRLTVATVMILQGRPLYHLNAISWDGHIPNVAWIWNEASPFGPKALFPASMPFKAALIYDSYDFVTPNHNAAMRQWWESLFSRLNGRLSVFSTEIEDVLPLLRNPDPIPKSQGNAGREASNQERNQSLTLTKVSDMSIQK